MDIRKYRVNQNIRAKEVRVVDENGQQIGIMPIQEALKEAQQRGLDLVEIAPQANPPVCKIIDFSKFKYQQQKKEKELKKSQRLSHIKEIYLKPSISDHDLLIKINHVKEFLQHLHPVKIVITYVGRLMEFFEQTSQPLVDKIVNELKDFGNITNIRKDKNRITIIIDPKKNK